MHCLLLSLFFYSTLILALLFNTLFWFVARAFFFSQCSGSLNAFFLSFSLYVVLLFFSCWTYAYSVPFFFWTFACSVPFLFWTFACSVFFLSVFFALEDSPSSRLFALLPISFFSLPLLYNERLEGYFSCRKSGEWGNVGLLVFDMDELPGNRK